MVLYYGSVKVGSLNVYVEKEKRKLCGSSYCSGGSYCNDCLPIVFLFAAKFLLFFLSHRAPAEMLHLAFPVYGAEQLELVSGHAYCSPILYII